jgi:hypothetical protein
MIQCRNSDSCYGVARMMFNSLYYGVVGETSVVDVAVKVSWEHSLLKNKLISIVS